VDNTAPSALRLKSNIFGTTSRRAETGRSDGACGGGAAGQAFTRSDTPGQVLTGTSGDDMFYAGHRSAVKTGNRGPDNFIFRYAPFNAGHMTDFTAGTVTLELTALF
jgi:hypothetical protein